MIKIIWVFAFIISTVSLKAQSAVDTVITKNLVGFYTRYIKLDLALRENPYSPKVVKGKKGFARLTINEYCDSLRTSGYFTEGFIASEKLRTLPCADKMAKIKYAKFRKFEYGEWPDECGFFYYDYLLNAQDVPNGIRIRSVKVEGSKATVNFTFYTGMEQDMADWPTNGIATMLIENNIWKIDALDLSK